MRVLPTWIWILAGARSEFESEFEFEFEFTWPAGRPLTGLSQPACCTGADCEAAQLRPNGFAAATTAAPASDIDSLRVV